MVGVNVVETGQNLVQDALDVLAFEVLVIAGLHQLVQVTVHVLHADVQLVGERVKENVECRDEMRMHGKGAQEDDFAELQAWT